MNKFNQLFSLARSRRITGSRQTNKFKQIHRRARFMTLLENFAQTSCRRSSTCKEADHIEKAAFFPSVGTRFIASADLSLFTLVVPLMNTGRDKSGPYRKWDLPGQNFPAESFIVATDDLSARREHTSNAPFILSTRTIVTLPLRQALVGEPGTRLIKRPCPLYGPSFIASNSSIHPISPPTLSQKKSSIKFDKTLRLLGGFLAASLACLCLLLLTPLTTYADGGAPNRAYVAGTGKGISVIDVAQQKIIDGLAAQGDPHEVLLSQDARFLYVTEPQQEHLAILSAVTGDIICTATIPGQPTLLALDTNSNTLYVAGNGAASVSAINPSNCNVKRTIQTSGPVYGLAIAAIGTTNTGSNGDQVWVSTKNQLALFNDNDGRAIGSVHIAGGPQYISIPPGSVAYVTTQQGGIVAVDLARHGVTPLMSGGKYEPMDFDEQTGEIFVPDHLHNQLAVLAPINPGFPAPKEPERTISLASAPNSVAITSDGQLGFVALQSGQVAMLDIPGRQLITTFNVGGNPQFIITGLNPPAIATTPQQASILGTLVNVASYALVAALIIVPLIFFTRYANVRKKNIKKDEGDSPQQDKV